MDSATPFEQTAVRRRVPTQDRSRERVAQILDAASQIVLAGGVEALSTRSIAEVADMPVASIYQYFSDKEAVMLAICERDMAEMDDQLAADLAALEVLSVRAVVETAMQAFVKVYHRRPAFMQIWMRGRNSAVVHDYGRRHNRRIAESLMSFGLANGLVDAGRFTRAELDIMAELSVEIGDRAFQLAFETDVRGDTFLLDQAIDAVAGYISSFATPAGIDETRR